ncbi:hypothetical protein AUP74_01923 [Microbulbifer aggregans]|uniref:Thymidine phosphorylase n=1 Tax=Microbulbifer aggregans TaxID=1769779 RepID=A0A1C9W888_9GAMM|nr:hypothetical protein AUP74_01923 [Microbulbifer aggregans]
MISLSGRSGDRADEKEQWLTRGSLSLPDTVITLRGKAKDLLLERLKHLFSKVDDSLFSMAERAHGQEEQDGLFQALRLLRVERRSLAARFAANIENDFQLQETTEEAEDRLLSENLSLVHNDDLEQMVAVETMVTNAERDFAEPLAELTLRLDSLYPLKVFEKNNPLRPESVCDAFVEALRPLEIHIRARLTVLKKFEQEVMVRLGEFYDGCNQLLVDQGVLPDLSQHRRAARREQARAGQPEPQETTPSTAGNSAGPVAQSGQGGAGVYGQGTPVAAGAAMQPPSAGQFAPGLLPPTAGLAPMPPSDLLGHLGELQNSATIAHGSGVQLLDVSQLLQQRLVEANQSASLAKVDSDIIKLVEMLFSFILEDRNLAEPIKSQLGRLQLPLLKVGIADKSLFSKGGHPARKLLNALADAATGWQAGESYERDPLYRETSGIVDRVLNEFDQDVGLFSELLASFQEFIARERKRAEMLERRVVDEADGRARTQAAKARVAAVVDALVAERDLPQVVHDWLKKVWSNVLFLTSVKEGTESEAWSREVRTARDLVWSVHAPMPDNRQQLLALLPALQERLKDGVKTVSLNPFEARRLFADLKEIYRERFALAQRLLAETEVSEQVQVEEEPNVPAQAISPVAESIESSETSGVDDNAVPQLEELEQVAADAEVSVSLPTEDDAQEVDENDAHWQMTFRLAQGSWFEFKRTADEQFRCRLAAVIKDIDQFIFVNRNGAKVAEFTRLELALALREVRLMPLDDGMLFERALQSVIGNVRKSRETTN